MQVAVYARVSSSEQTTENQLIPIREYCQRVKHVVIKEYVDDGFSGKDNKRPAFEEMLVDIRAGKVEGVVCYKLDRVGRSLQHLLNLFEEFNNRNISFVSLSQNIDTTTPEGRMFLKMLMVLSEYERELIVARTKDGLSRALKQGKRLGRPKGQKDTKIRCKSGYYARWLRLKGSEKYATI